MDPERLMSITNANIQLSAERPLKESA